jgi:hypothetical protein
VKKEAVKPGGENRDAKTRTIPWPQNKTASPEVRKLAAVFTSTSC